VKAKDGYTKDFASQDVAWSNDYIIANKLNGKPITESGPLRLVGDGVAKDGALGGHSVGSVAEIELTAFGGSHTCSFPSDRKVCGRWCYCPGREDGGLSLDGR